MGSGKSTISEKISKIIDARHIPIDRVLDEHCLTADKEEGYISQKSFMEANKIVESEVIRLLREEKPVIFDGNFYWKSQVDDLISRLNFPHYVFTLKAPLKVCITRDAEREKTHGKDAAMVVYRKSTEFTYGIEIDVTKNIDECINEILSFLPNP